MQHAHSTSHAACHCYNLRRYFIYCSTVVATEERRHRVDICNDPGVCQQCLGPGAVPGIMCHRGKHKLAGTRGHCAWEFTQTEVQDVINCAMLQRKPHTVRVAWHIYRAD